MELLAPAGSFAALRAAVENGADAVYLGGKMYSARASAANFSSEELQAALDYCHIRGVKVYVSVNTLLRDDELDGALMYLADLYRWGADAVIVQDLGLIKRARQELPELELHGSTQMTLHSTGDVQAAEDLGLKRVVLARELGLAAIGEIKAHTALELEVFVHGALCICYSGQCLMSSLIGGRSGNRGRCAQPCRQPYQMLGLDVPGPYVLSPRDLCLIQHLDGLRQAGAASLKIEGRLKSPDYVGVVVRTYRAALDGQPYEPQELSSVFNRGFTTAHIGDQPPTDLITYLPPAREERTGSARDTYSSPRAVRRVRAHLWARLRQGDSLELTLVDEDGVHAQARGSIAAEPAKGSGISPELLREKLLRLGNDPLEIVEFEVELEQGVHLPVSELNRTRRELVTQWEKQRLAGYKQRDLPPGSSAVRLPPKAKMGGVQIAVTVSDVASTEAAVKAGAHLIYFSGQVYRKTPLDWLAELTQAWEIGRRAGVPVFVHLERITENHMFPEIERALLRHSFDGVLLGNFGTWRRVKTMFPDIPVHADWSFNVFNSWAVQHLAEEGAALITASLELKLSDIKAICGRSPLDVGVVAHGPLESMVSKHCWFRDQGCRLQCQSQTVQLKDEKGFVFPVRFDRWCRMHIFNSRELSLLNHLERLKDSGISLLRVEGRTKDPNWIGQVVTAYKRRLAGEEVHLAGEFTKGHYFRGVL